jgi:hypothetical protein
MTEDEKTFDGLVGEALENARSDRDRILEAYEKMKIALDAANAEQTVMMGQTATKLLEQLNKANEQVVRLAQIKERRESKLDDKKKDDGPIDIDDIKELVERQKKESFN